MRIGWWMGVLFAIGSACFTVAALASQWASAPRPGIGVTFFVGSIFFTSAAALQFHDALNGTRIDRLAAGIQLVGTIFFNVNTFAAMDDGLTTKQELLRVWTPDVIGSICFLVSSELSYAEVCGAWISFQNRTRAWWIAAVNMLGSIFFGVSAVTSLIVPSTNEPVSAHIANATTALGGACFFIGAILLIAETAADDAAPRAADAPLPSASVPRR
jgi:hypothetical protein